MGFFHLDKVVRSQAVVFEQKPGRTGQKAAGYVEGEGVQEQQSVKFQVLNGCMTSKVAGVAGAEGGTGSCLGSQQEMRDRQS